MSLHADVVEVVWLLVAVLGLVLVLEELVVARADRRLVTDERARSLDLVSDREVTLELAIAEDDVASAWWLLGLQVANAAVGILAALSPMAGNGSRSPLGWVIVAVLIAGAAAVPARSLGRRRRRRRLLDLAA